MMRLLEAAVKARLNIIVVGRHRGGEDDAVERALGVHRAARSAS